MTEQNVYDISAGIDKIGSQVNAIAAYSGSRKSQQRQQDYSKELMGLQNTYNIDAEKRAMDRSKEMYEYTGYGSRVRQMKEAGLNPALMYGQGGGQGGTTVSSTPMSISGQSAPNTAEFDRNTISVMGMGLQMAKLRSEIAVNESIAKKQNAEAELTSGAQTEKISTETKNLNTTREGQELTNAKIKMENMIMSATTPSQIDQITNLSKITSENLTIVKNNKKISNETVDTAINQAKATYEKTLSETLKLNTEKKLTDQQIDKVINEIKQKWTELGQNNQRLQIEIQKILYDNDAQMERAKLEAWVKLATSMTTFYQVGLLNKWADEIEPSVHTNTK